MKPLTRTVGTLVGTAMAAFFAIFLITLVLSMAAQDYDGLHAFSDELRCFAGVPKEDSPCVQDMMDDLAAARDQLHDVVATQDFVFTQGPEVKQGHSLVVGTFYEDADTQTGLVRAYCWVIVDQGGLDPRVGLSVLHSDGRIDQSALSFDDLALLDLSPSEIDAARSECPFPPVS